MKLAGLVVLCLGFWLLHLFVEPSAQLGGWRSAQAPAWQRILLMLLGLNALGLAWVLLAAGFGGRQDWRDPRALRAAFWRWLAANLLVPVFVLQVFFGWQAPADQALGGPVGQASADVGDWLLEGIGSLASVGLFLLILFFGRRGLQHEAPTAEEAMRRDPRPPVIYLRSFQDDGQALEAPFDPGGLGRRIATVLMHTPEQELADALAHVGPVIAIGKPGEQLPELGAARLYVPHDSWQARVNALLDAAALVVLRVGSSPGVRWEIEQTLARVPPARRLFVLLGSPAVLDAGAALLGPMIGHHLSWPDLPRTRWQQAQVALGLRPRVLGAMVVTDASGMTRQLPLVLRLFRSSGLRRPAGPAIGQAFASIDAPWARRPPSGPSRAMAVGLALGLGGVGAHWFYLRRPRRAWAHVLLLTLTVSVFWAWWQALCWLLMDRASFDAHVSPAASGSPATAPHSTPPRS